jgi:hypothetical protein
VTQVTAFVIVVATLEALPAASFAVKVTVTTVSADPAGGCR